MQTEIAAWLVSGFYAQGVALLERCAGVRPQWVAYFKRYALGSFVPTAVEKELEQELRLQAKLWEAAPEPEPVRAKAEASPPAGPEEKKAAATGDGLGFWAALASKKHLPNEIMELRERAIELHKRESLVHGKMGWCAKRGHKKKAYEYAKEIMEEIRPELDGIYDAVREWEKSGKLPPAPVRNDAVKEALELAKRLKYRNERICRIGGWLKDGYREKTVKGEKVNVLLTAKDIQQLDNERLGLLVEVKGIKEKLGI